MRSTLLAIAAALLAPAAAAQTLYKCVLPTGRVVYQDSTCDDRAKQSTVRGADPAPPRPLPPGDERRDAPPQAEVGTIVTVLSGFQGCAQDVPGFSLKHAQAFNDWKLRNAAAMAAYGRNEGAQQKVRESMEEQLRSASTDPAARAERAAACEKDVAGWFTPPQPKN
jgi:hypothetical protein